MLYSKSRIKIIIIVFIAIIGVSIGFATFSNSVSISTTYKIQPDSTEFSVGLSNTSGSIVSGEVEPVIMSGTAEASNLIITNSNGVSSISGGSVIFNPTGVVRYEFYVHNSGKYTAYLNSVTFNNPTGESSFKVCTPLPGEISSTITSACNNLIYTFLVGGSPYSTTNLNITGHTLAAGDSEKITILIIQSSNNPKDFKFKFGSIDLVYSTAD